MSKKIITELTDEELNKLLEDSSNSESITVFNKNDINEFISVYGIKSGTYQVSIKLLGKLYRQWSKDPIHPRTFANCLTDLFPYIRGGDSNFLCVNKDVWKLKEVFDNYFKSQEKTKMKHYKTHFDAFINYYKLKKGSFFIKDNVLYNLYDKWTYKNKNNNPLIKSQFINFCKLYFPKYKKIEKIHWFPIDHSINQYLSEELKRQMSEKDKKIPG